MVINLLLMIVLIWFVIHNFIKAKKFVSFNNWHDYFVPIYSIVLFLVTMKWDTTNVTIFLILLPVALVTGYLETKGVELKKENSKKRDKIVEEIKIKRGSPYAFGWLFTFALGILIHCWFSRDMILNMFTEAIWDNIIEEINPLALFTTNHTWYIWFLSGVSSLTFIMTIRIAITRMIRKKRTKEEI